MKYSRHQARNCATQLPINNHDDGDDSILDLEVNLEANIEEINNLAPINNPANIEEHQVNIEEQNDLAQIDNHDDSDVVDPFLISLY